MKTDVIHLTSAVLEVDVDPRRGADVLQVRHLPSRSRLLFETPWRDHAEAVRSASRPPASADSFGRWLEGYRGGWQVLCPNAGAEREVAGGRVGFHGEAALIPWTVVLSSPNVVDLTVTLFSVPVRIDRSVSVVDDQVTVKDTLTNLSPVRLDLDYSMHPALGGDLLAGACRLDTSARTFVADPEAPGARLVPGSSHRWPHVRDVDGVGIDLRQVPGPEMPRSLFGWLTDFEGPAWATVAAAERDLAVRLTWDAAILPHAWLWQELGATATFPWFTRARALAIEPASTVTSGAGRERTLDLAPYAAASVIVDLAVGPVDRIVPTPRGVR